MEDKHNNIIFQVSYRISVVLFLIFVSFYDRIFFDFILSFEIVLQTYIKKIHKNHADVEMYKIQYVGRTKLVTKQIIQT